MKTAPSSPRRHRLAIALALAAFAVAVAIALLVHGPAHGPDVVPEDAAGVAKGGPTLAPPDPVTAAQPDPSLAPRAGAIPSGPAAVPPTPDRAESADRADRADRADPAPARVAAGGLPPVGGLALAPAPGGAAPRDNDDDDDEVDREDAERLVYSPDAPGIRAAIAAEHPALKACYAAWLQASPGLEGRVATRLVISDPGEGGDERLARVTEVAIADSSLTDRPGRAAIESCILNVMSSLRFDPPESGTLTVNYPLRFAIAEGEDPVPPTAAPR